VARRSIGHGLELDDDRGRIDVDAVHGYLSNDSYWAQGRSRDEVARSVALAARVVGCYQGEKQVGFARVVSDEVEIAYLCDVYLLEHCRGKGAGVELVREAVDNGPHRDLRWWLATRDAHGLYARFGFEPPGPRFLTREPRG
jgi:GNAT superfamily N-acetyltransferase